MKKRLLHMLLLLKHFMFILALKLTFVAQSFESNNVWLVNIGVTQYNQ